MQYVSVCYVCGYVNLALAEHALQHLRICRQAKLFRRGNLSCIASASYRWYAEHFIISSQGTHTAGFHTAACTRLFSCSGCENPADSLEHSLWKPTRSSGYLLVSLCLPDVACQALTHGYSFTVAGKSRKLGFWSYV
jgi:hypothetical protein